MIQKKTCENDLKKINDKSNCVRSLNSQKNNLCENRKNPLLGDNTTNGSQVPSASGLKMLVMTNKRPFWNEQSQVYQVYFFNIP